MADPITVGLALQTIGIGGGFLNSRKLDRNAARQNRLQQRQAQLSNILARRRSLAQERRLQSTSAAIAQATGGGAGSAEAGAISSARAQSQANRQVQREQEFNSNQLFELGLKAQKIAQTDSVFNAVGQLGGLVGGLQSFGGSTPTELPSLGSQTAVTAGNSFGTGPTVASPTRPAPVFNLQEIK